ncbi:hypothetical protein ACVWYN_000457 [Pedobacter sp. UYP24]
MAKYDGKFIRGIVGKGIFRELNGQQIIQGRTEKPKINRTKATEKAATIFGVASNFSSYIRDNFNSVIRDRYDTHMCTRLSSQVLQCFRAAARPDSELFDFTPTSFNRLIGFEFNLKSQLKDIFFAQPMVHIHENQMQVVIPEMNLNEDLKFPRRAKKCKLVLGHVQFDLTNGFFNETEYAILDIENNKENPIFPLHSTIFNLQPGCYSVLTVTVQFIETTFFGDNFINDKSFNPVAILSSYIIDGTLDKSVTEKWHEMSFKNYLAAQLPQTVSST